MQLNLKDFINNRKESVGKNLGSMSVTIDIARVHRLFKRVESKFDGFDLINNSQKIDFLMYSLETILNEMANSPKTNSEDQESKLKKSIWADFEALESEGIPHARYMSNCVTLMRNEYGLEFKDE